MSSRDTQPKHEAANLRSRKERRQPFCIPCGDTAPLLDVEKCVLDEMSLLVEMSIIVTQHFSVLSRRDHRPHALLLGKRDDGVTVVTFVGDQMLGTQTLNEFRRQARVRSGSLCSKDSDRHTMRIHGRMYLGVEPPSFTFVRPIPSLPPRAPAACGCTLQ